MSQELLANNNVVIIEPIRTKIEKITEKTHDPQTVQNYKITGRTAGAKANGTADGKSGLKRHFFYHPIRVNKELLDEELPTPDTVKNARKLFEETLKLRAAAAAAAATSGGDAAAVGMGKTTESSRKKAMRHLTIDTASYGGSSVATKTTSSNASGAERKWDSSSLSSGISSGELSSPCECNMPHAEQKELFSSEENICDDELCESYYVSQVSVRDVWR